VVITCLRLNDREPLAIVGPVVTPCRVQMMLLLVEHSAYLEHVCDARVFFNHVGDFGRGYVRLR
jgi:hypothetical protein